MTFETKVKAVVLLVVMTITALLVWAFFELLFWKLNLDRLFEWQNGVQTEFNRRKI